MKLSSLGATGRATLEPTSLALQLMRRRWAASAMSFQATYWRVVRVFIGIIGFLISGAAVLWDLVIGFGPGPTMHELELRQSIAAAVTVVIGMVLGAVLISRVATGRIGGDVDAA
jgi:hypothetical protein